MPREVYAIPAAREVDLVILGRCAQVHRSSSGSGSGGFLRCGLRDGFRPTEKTANGRLVYGRRRPFFGAQVHEPRVRRARRRRAPLARELGRYCRHRHWRI